VNIFPSLLAKQQNFRYFPRHVTTRTIAGSKFANHGSVVTTFELQDSHGTWQAYHETAVVSPDVQTITLGIPWLRKHNPRVDWSSGKVEFREKLDHPDALVQLASAEDVMKDVVFVGIITVRPSPTEESYKDVQIPEEYQDFADVFSEERADQLPPHRDCDMVVDLEEGKTPPFGPLYNLSEPELRELRAYIEKNLARGWIRPSKSSAAAPILFAKKKDGGLRLCVDYRGLNQITLRNRYPLPLIDNIIDRLGMAKIFTQLDIRDAYHKIRIATGQEWKTAFRTQYGLYEYLVMPFGLTNAPAVFQSYINSTLREFIDIFVVVYLDDIIVFSQTLKEHIQHVRRILTRLREAGLYLKLSKCRFHAREINYLGYLVSSEGISVEPARVETIISWPEPQNIRDIQSFLGFANFYRRFIRNFAKITVPLTDLLKKANREARRKAANTDEFLPPSAKQAFRKLQQAFAETVLMYHFDPTLPTRLETDSSGFAICGILTQLNSFGNWVPVAFYSRKMSSHERNYGIHDQELLAIVESFREWRHYLEGSRSPVEIITDHDSLRYFNTCKQLSRRQVRWAQDLSVYWFKVMFREGKKNPADLPSRRVDYQKVANVEDLGEGSHLSPKYLRNMLTSCQLGEPDSSLSVSELEQALD
jgi:RNase H-like domain found in reverse transcriptase/Reverse transcriptase (RNA-dependent DNA polymerase)